MFPNHRTTSEPRRLPFDSVVVWEVLLEFTDARTNAALALVSKKISARARERIWKHLIYCHPSVYFQSDQIGGRFELHRDADEEDLLIAKAPLVTSLEVKFDGITFNDNWQF
jgi:hypothetical protein